MTSALDQFVQQVIDSNLLSADAVRSVIDSQPVDQKPQDAEQLAQELVRRELLTAYQAEQIQAGQGGSLILDNYVILDKLGQGGMGLVLKAEHRRMKRLVALKVLSPQVIRTPELLRRFQREVEAAARLSHPNIVIAHDADEAGGTHFLVMEYVDGTDLSTLVKRDGPLPIDRAVDYVLQAARGLEYAHQHGVIHRDIKPSNLLVECGDLSPLSLADRATATGGNQSRLGLRPDQPGGDGVPTYSTGHVKILDMGLARIESAGVQQDELTGSAQIMGTVDYMAPEQAVSTKRADQRADIYSLGITLWYLLTGRPAYPGETAVEKLLAHQTQPIPSLRSQRPGVSPTLDAVFAKMVAKTPEARYQTMSEVIAALESCRSTASCAAAELEATLDMSSPQVATAPQTQASLAAQRPPWWRDRRFALVAAGALVILLGGWLAGRGRESFSGNDAQPRTTPDAVAANLKSEIADLKYEEPPPLEEWLKGRTILTVAQDGRGQFRTIADAVKALKPGQVVEILDEGPYQENLWVENPPADTAIVSKVNTVMRPTNWRTHESLRTTARAHRVESYSAVRVAGLALLAPVESLPPECDSESGLSLQVSDTCVIEQCVATSALVQRDGAREATAIQCSVLGGRLFIRESSFVGAVTLLGTAARSFCILERNWCRRSSRTSVALGRAVRGVVVVRRNVLFGAMVIHATEDDEHRLSCLSNSLLGALIMSSNAVRIQGSSQRNIFCGGLSTAVTTAPPQAPYESIKLRANDNVIWPGDPREVELAKSFGVGTVVEQPNWLSLDPHDHRNYMRVSNPSVVLNRDGRQEYIGALPPGPAPPEGDWFTRLLERWEEVQQRIEELESPKESRKLDANGEASGLGR